MTNIKGEEINLARLVLSTSFKHNLNVIIVDI